jgi:hypothetical protein
MASFGKIRARATYANVTATLALFVALGGGSFAVAALSGSEKKVVKKIATKQADKRINALAPVIADEQINKRAPGLTVGTANNANALGGQEASAFQTASASDTRTDVVAAEGTLNPALRATMSTSAPRTLTAVASVEVSADGGDNDNVNCLIEIDGVRGDSQSTYITPQPTFAKSTVVPLTMARAVGAGTHTVFVHCGDGIGSNTSLEDRFLTVVATG